MGSVSRPRDYSIFLTPIYVDFSGTLFFFAEFGFASGRFTWINVCHSPDFSPFRRFFSPVNQARRMCSTFMLTSPPLLNEVPCEIKSCPSLSQIKHPAQKPLGEDDIFVPLTYIFQPKKKQYVQYASNNSYLLTEILKHLRPKVANVDFVLMSILIWLQLPGCSL